MLFLPLLTCRFNPRLLTILAPTASKTPSSQIGNMSEREEMGRSNQTRNGYGVDGLEYETQLLRQLYMMRFVDAICLYVKA